MDVAYAARFPMERRYHPPLNGQGVITVVGDIRWHVLAHVVLQGQGTPDATRFVFYYDGVSTWC